VITEKGPFGINLRFNEGLVVLQGENASGKSTCLAAILYALGLEGICIRGQDSPFPEAITDRIHDGESWLAVLESHVHLEFEVGQQEIYSATRAATGSKEQRQLITVFSGPILSSPNGAYARRDFFVRIPRAAQSESGFHYFLADALGLRLPKVPKYDGEPVPLYLEALFPLVFVDQLRGWTGLASRMPTHFGIIDLWTSVIEYLLALDIQANALKRHELRNEADQLRRSWCEKVRDFERATEEIGTLMQGVEREPMADWPPRPTPLLLVTEGEEWIAIEKALRSRRRRLRGLSEKEIPRIKNVAIELRDEVFNAERDLDRLEAQQLTLAREIRAESEQLEAINVRIEALQEDRRKYKDEQKLRRRGAPGNLRLISQTCPTCKQSLKDSLLPQDTAGEPMKLEDNLRFVEGQIGLFEELRKESTKLVATKRARLNALQRKVADQALVLRDRRRAFRGDAEAPSVAAIRERLLEEDRTRRLEGMSTRFEKLLADLASISALWRQNQGALKSVQQANLSEGDEKKLARIERSVIGQLREYNLKSFEPEKIVISRENYRPTRDGVTLPSAVQMSASDSVRLIWAYLVALLELAREESTNHPGLLIFDEPQQQHMREISFAALLGRVAPSKAANQQVIIATSEDSDSLSRMLDGIPSQIIPLPALALQPMS